MACGVIAASPGRMSARHSRSMTRAGGARGVTVQDMRVHALLDSARRLSARGGAGLVDVVVALVLLAVALAVLAASSRG